MCFVCIGLASADGLVVAAIAESILVGYVRSGGVRGGVGLVVEGAGLAHGNLNNLVKNIG